MVDRVLSFLIVLTVVFNVLFPKGGFTIGPLPITWGYILLGLLAATWLATRALKRAGMLSVPHVRAFYAIVPFQMFVVSALLLLGWVDTGKAVAVVINAVVLPVLIFLCLGTLFRDCKARTLAFETLRICVLAAAIYGILLFIYYLKTGSLFEIPFITSNGTQDVELESKHNVRGDFLKLISTYNNGNIYGACTLMLLPVFCAIERNLIKIWTVKAAIFLTLSRTAWIGLICYEGGAFLLSGGSKTKKVLYLVLAIPVLALAVLVMTNYMGRDEQWLADPNLGGRLFQVDRVFDGDINFLPNKRFGSVGEIVYLGMLYWLGILGFSSFLLSMMWIPLLEFLKTIRSKVRDPIKVASFLGLTLYWVICGADGAYSFIPTMAIYWSLVALLCSGGCLLNVEDTD